MIAKSADFAKPVLNFLRGLIHEAVPDVEEEIKWSRPFFLVNGTIVCHMVAFKHHCGFGFWSPAMTSVLQANGVDGSDGAGDVGKITCLADLPARADLLRYLRIAAESARSGTSKSPMSPRKRVSGKPEIQIPVEFGAALSKSNAAGKYFESLPPSCRREYMVWITTAKRPDTRERRIAQAIAMLESGRRWDQRPH